MTVEYQKVWRTMNDLELVTSKICSAREIIDAAIDRIQENQYDKAEMMISAAHEFLEYYLQEFDEKFKLAWQATVGDLRDGDVKKDDKSWNSFWEDVDNWSKEHQQYTEEELNAMCDKAELDAEVERIRQEGGYEWTPEVSKKKWVLPVQQSYIDGVDDCFVYFPNDLLEAAKLKEGDTIEWVDKGDGSYLLRKVSQPLGMDEC